MSDFTKYLPSDEQLAAVAHNTALYLTCNQPDALDDLKDEILAAIEKAVRRERLEAKAEVIDEIYFEDGNLPPIISRDGPIPVVVDSQDLRKRKESLEAALAALDAEEG